MQSVAAVSAPNCFEDYLLALCKEIVCTCNHTLMLQQDNPAILDDKIKYEINTFKEENNLSHNDLNPCFKKGM